MPPSLDNPRAKLDRAAEHLAVLDTETAAYFEAKPKPYEVESEFEPDLSEYIFRIKVLREPPVRLGLLLGDFVHNLRAALDHLVCQLALLDGATGCETTQFPICSETEFKRRAPNWLAGLSNTHVADIERLQPYHTGKDAPHHFLTILNDLDNIDKHRLVHPTFGYFQPTKAEAKALRFVALNRDVGTVRWRRVAGGRRIEGDADIARIKLAPLGPNPKMAMEGKLTFDPAFGSEWLRGSAVPELYRRVQRIVESFVADFL